MFLTEQAHPATSFLYFLSVVVLTVSAQIPAVSVIFFVGGCVAAAFSDGIKDTGKKLALSLPLVLAVTAANFLFVHKGKTVLFRAAHTAFTLEAIVYGVFSGITLAAVFIWCAYAVKALTSDKITSLFGKILPKLSLITVMTFRFIPLLLRRYKDISDAQRVMGLDQHGKAGRIRSTLRSVSALTSLSLESSVETAESMVARGYGLPGRSTFAFYRFTFRDALFVTLDLSLSAAFLFLTLTGKASAEYYPRFSGIGLSSTDLILYIITFVFAFIPAFAETGDRIKWHFLKSKI